MSYDWLYYTGLALAILYIATGFDDFIWDLSTLFGRRTYKKQLLDIHKLDNVPPKLLAIMIAAWHEDNVLGDVIDNIVESAEYPRSMYHIFLGVYPNDPATIAVAKQLAAKYEHVHMIINDLPGPTSKAQNLNYVIKQIRKFEAEKQWSFASLTIHDSEDVVHPYEFKVTSYLLDKYPAIQFPVFPLIQMPKFSNFFKNITTSTYADEFAENHFSTMVSRYSSGAFVPSAGTGLVLSRETLASFGDDDILPSDSLTEDYRLSLTLYERGIQLYYALLKVPRINQQDKLVYEYIATRSRFPHTFKTAVRQKTRWILGITMQSFRFKDIFKTKNLSFSGRYSLYRDFKAKIGNLLIFVGYPIFIYFIASIFIDLPPVYPKYSVSWYLCILVSIMMIERQIFRGIAIYRIYGMRSVFFACLFPPIVPIRLVYGNAINFTATVRAYKERLFGKKTPKKEAKKQAKEAKKLAKKQQKAEKSPENKADIAWDKTEHHFLPKEVLKRYHRKLGDVLLQKGYIEPNVLQEALKESTQREQELGSYLVETAAITEPQLLDALASTHHEQYIDVTDLNDYAPQQYMQLFDEQLLRDLSCVPILPIPDGFIFAFCEKSPRNAGQLLREQTTFTTIHFAHTSVETIEHALNTMYQTTSQPKQDLAFHLFNNKRITAEQLLLVQSYQQKTEKTEYELLNEMGLYETKNSDTK